MNSLKNLYRLIKRYLIDSYNARDYQIKLFNYSFGNFQNYIDKVPYEQHWLYQFIENRGYLKNKKYSLSIFSVHGNRYAININRSKYKIFYTLENVHVKDSYWNKYEDLLLSENKINLSLGFDYINNDKYIRFPYWLMTVFEPNETYESIKAKCDSINNRVIDTKKKKFCSFICRNDYFGDRKYFLDIVSRIETVNCPGRFMHNDDDLVNLYADNKRKYLNQFKFNLCPENTNSEGYVTEKIFDSILSGCIPLYWGSNNQPEPNILNQNKILFLELASDNDQMLDKLRQLWSDEDVYYEYISQPTFLPDAADIIYSYFKELEDYLNKLLK